MQGDEEEATSEKLVMGLAIVGFVAASLLLAFQLMIAGVWINVEDNDRQGDWSQLFD